MNLPPAHPLLNDLKSSEYREYLIRVDARIANDIGLVAKTLSITVSVDMAMCFAIKEIFKLEGTKEIAVVG